MKASIARRDAYVYLKHGLGELGQKKCQFLIKPW
jgi:hypothetical protein